jgi:HSP20 family molecular chaperone IbpA
MPLSRLRGIKFRKRVTMPLAELPCLGFDPLLVQSERNRVFSGFSATATRDLPPTNIWLGENSAIVTAELTEVTSDHVGIKLQDEVLRLEGTREFKMPQPDMKWIVASALTGHSRAHSTGVPHRPRQGRGWYHNSILEHRTNTTAGRRAEED